MAPSNWYRDREKPYDEIPIRGWRTYFITNQPADWRKNAGTRDEFAKMYGELALAAFDAHGYVPENIEKSSVAGPSGRQTWFDPVPAPQLVPGPDEMIVNSPMGPVIVKKPLVQPAAAVDLTPVLEALAGIGDDLDRIEAKVNALLS